MLTLWEDAPPVDSSNSRVQYRIPMPGEDNSSHLAMLTEHLTPTLHAWQSMSRHCCLLLGLH